ncbi:MAG: DUF4388 domain-containing protein [Chloroflexi bacterium]|nr:MAG: DUF4388 domain-containing protein [Chloroflexota bacterium]
MSYKKGVWCAMANDRAMMANSVSNMLESARLRRQSGRLSIEQANNGRIQEGEIHLQAGQPVYARLGQIVGQEALTRLLLWRNVQFTFHLDTPAAAPSAGAYPLPAQSSSEQSNGSGSSRVSPSSPGIEWLVPQKRDTERDVLSLPLTRRQRFIYFLVDGRRSLSDLSRCTGKTIQEIELILSELQAQGLVSI